MMLRNFSAVGEPPGSRVVTTSRPRARSRAARRSTCVLLPAPSPPSNVMKRFRPKLMSGACEEPGEEFHRVRVQRTGDEFISGVKGALNKRALFDILVGRQRHFALQK